MFHPLEDALLRGDALCINIDFQRDGFIDVSVQLDGEPFYEAMDFTSVDDALSAISEFVRNDYHMRPTLLAVDESHALSDKQVSD